MNDGAIFGPYRIERMLGQGGMGTVFLARHVDLDRPVALKTIGIAMRDDPELLMRFRREAECAMQIEHPGLVKFYDYGSIDDVPYLAMEYIPGRTIAQQLVAGGAWPPDRVIWMLLELLDALAALHDAALVHRDVTPSNVFLDATGRIRLLDLGLAKFLDRTPITDPARALGTPAYLPPEAVVGETVGPESDIYQAALVARELASGTAAYSGSRAVDVLARIVNGPHPPPLRVDGALGLALSLFVIRATAPDPGRRWPHARAARESLVRLARRKLPEPSRRLPSARTIKLPRARRTRRAGRAGRRVRLDRARPSLGAPMLLMLLTALLVGRFIVAPAPIHTAIAASTPVPGVAAIVRELTRELGRRVTEKEVKSLRTKVRHRLNRPDEEREVLSTWRDRYRSAFLVSAFQELARSFLAVRDRVPDEPALAPVERSRLLRVVEDLADLNAVIREAFGARWRDPLVELTGGRLDGAVSQPNEAAVALMLRFGGGGPPGVQRTFIVPGTALFSCADDPLLDDTVLSASKRVSFEHPLHPTNGKPARRAWIGVRCSGGRPTEKLVFWLGSAGSWREVAFVRADGRNTPHEEWREIDARLFADPGTRLRITFEYRSVPVIPRGIDVGWIALAIVPQ